MWELIVCGGGCLIGLGGKGGSGRLKNGRWKMR